MKSKKLTKKPVRKSGRRKTVVTIKRTGDVHVIDSKTTPEEFQEARQDLFDFFTRKLDC